MRALSLILLVCAIAIPVAGCGDDDDDGGNGGSGGGGGDSGGAQSKKSDNGGGGSSGGGQTLKIAADAGGRLKFDKSSLTAKAGKVTIVTDNPSDLPHAIEVEGQGMEIKGETVEKGGVSKASGELKPGKYEFYCPVDSHKQAGMEGTLTVQ